MMSSSREHRTYLIGVVKAKLCGDFEDKVLSGITEVLQSTYHSAIALHQYSGTRERSHLEGFIESRVDGIIAGYSGDAKNVSLFKEIVEKYEIPVVLIDRMIPELHLPVVHSDFFACTYKATQALQSLGHNRILFASMDQRLVNTQLNIQGYQQAMTKAGFERNINVLNHTVECWDKNDFKRYAKDIMGFWLADTMRPTAILLQNDWLAYEILNECTIRGVKVPQEISVMGMGDSFPSSLESISLSTIAEPLEVMGRKAAELLLKLIDGEPADVEEVILPIEVKIRNSTAHMAERADC